MSTFVNNGDIAKYLTESCLEAANNQFFLIFFQQARPKFDKKNQEKLAQYEMMKKVKNE